MASKRILFLDLVRGMAVVFMILQHAMIIYAVDEGRGHGLGEAVLLAGTAPAAPVFMVIMGIFCLKVRNRRALAVRGIGLILLGYLLNGLRFSLPTLVGGDYPLSGPDSPLGQLLIVDILHLAGAGLVVISLIRRLPPWSWLFSALLVGLISPLLWARGPSHPVFDLFWGSHDNVAFPLFPWLAYPLFGMYWGHGFLNTPDRNRYLGISLGAGLGLMVLGLLIRQYVDSPLLPEGDYSRNPLQIHLVILGFVLAWFWLFRHLEDLVLRSGLSHFLEFWSRNITTVYVIQWVVVGWGMLIWEYRSCTVETAFTLGVALVVLTHWLTRFYLWGRSFLSRACPRAVDSWYEKRRGCPLNGDRGRG